MAQWLREVSIGDWFMPNVCEHDQPFEIVGIDLKAEIVLVQFADGAVDEFDFDSWAELEARPCAPPNDLAGVLDTEPEDFGFIDDHTGRAGAGDPVQWLDSHGL